MIEHEKWIIFSSRHWYFHLNFSLIFPLIFSLIFPWIIVLRRFVSRFHLSEKTTPETLHSTPQRWWPKWARHIAPVKTTSLHLKKTGEKCEKPIAVLLKLGFYDCKGISQQSIGNVFSARNEGGFSHHPNSLSLIFFRGVGSTTNQMLYFRLRYKWLNSMVYGRCIYT